jgi:hypothetical protein
MDMLSPETLARVRRLKKVASRSANGEPLVVFRVLSVLLRDFKIAAGEPRPFWGSSDPWVELLDNRARTRQIRRHWKTKMVKTGAQT